MARRPERDEDWNDLRDLWHIRADTVYLNHGSFGPPPEPVRRARREWQDRLDEQPMDFFVRQLEPAWFDARQRLAEFVQAPAEGLIFVDNATVAMNLAASSFPLSDGDEVILTDHEYGAVERTWTRACDRAGARLMIAELPRPIESVPQVVSSVFDRVTPRTRLIVISHITSPTAVILPVEAICREAKSRGIATCIDGPHALVQTDVNMSSLECDFYAASCHKWLCAPFGSGFLYVAERFRDMIQPAITSWGRIPPNEPKTWSDEFVWSGTRDPSAYFCIPSAIEFFRGIGCDLAQARMHSLARDVRCRLVNIGVGEPIVPDSDKWYGSMAHMPLPPGDARQLQNRLWERHGIEVPIVNWKGQRGIRVSCHIYNRRDETHRLIEALDEEIKNEERT